MKKRPVIVQLLQPAAPHQFAVVHRDIRATVTHILPAIGLKVHRLDDHETLDEGRPKKIYRIRDGIFYNIEEYATHLFIDQTNQKGGYFASGYAFGLGIGQIGAGEEMVEGLYQLHEARGHIAHGLAIVHDAVGQ